MTLPDSAPRSQQWYMLESISDRDRLYLMFDVLHDSFKQDIAKAFSYAGVAPDAPWSLLDVCCGEGLHAVELAQRYSSSRIVAFDKDEEAVTTATNAFVDVKNVSFLCHDALAPLPDGVVRGFDLAQVRFGLTHFRDPVGGIGQIRDALRPGGIVYFIDPRGDVFQHYDHPSLQFLDGLVQRAWASFGTTAAGDRQAMLCEKAGLRVVDSSLQEHRAGGGEERGRSMLKLMIETLRTMRKALVETLQLIDAADFDEHLRRIQADATADHAGACRFQVTFAQKV